VLVSNTSKTGAVPIRAPLNHGNEGENGWSSPIDGNDGPSMIRRFSAKALLGQVSGEGVLIQVKVLSNSLPRFCATLQSVAQETRATERPSHVNNHCRWQEEHKETQLQEGSGGPVSTIRRIGCELHTARHYKRKALRVGRLAMGRRRSSHPVVLSRTHDIVSAGSMFTMGFTTNTHIIVNLADIGILMRHIP
jgi:hypothetical protein